MSAIEKYLDNRDFSEVDRYQTARIEALRRRILELETELEWANEKVLQRDEMIAAFVRHSAVFQSREYVDGNC